MKNIAATTFAASKLSNIAKAFWYVREAKSFNEGVTKAWQGAEKLSLVLAFNELVAEVKRAKNVRRCAA